MVRSEILIFNQGVEVPTRRLFRVLQPYFMPERLAQIEELYHNLRSLTPTPQAGGGVRRSFCSTIVCC